MSKIWTGGQSRGVLMRICTGWRFRLAAPSLRLGPRRGSGSIAWNISQGRCAPSRPRSAELRVARPAGASAALGARQAGADVLVLERSAGGGGTSASSGGLIYLGGGTATQTLLGFEDSPEEMLKYLMAACGPDVD